MRDPKSAQIAPEPSRTKALLTFERVYTENGVSNVDATLATLIRFDQPFSVSAQIHDDTLRASGRIHGNNGEYFRAEMGLANSSHGLEINSNVMMKFDKPLILGGASNGSGGRMEQFRITVTQPVD
jgi:hypothetical protein